MKHVLIVTHIKFWQCSSGDAVRLHAIVSFLRTRTVLTVAYGGGYDLTDQRQTAALATDFRIVMLGGYNASDISAYLTLFGQYVSEQRFDVCIVEHAFLSILTEALPPNVKLILDTHDIVADRVESLRKMGVEPRPIIDIPAARELAYFLRFDLIMAINNADYDKITKMVKGKKVILAPHPIIPRKHAIRPEPRVIGFIGSSYPPNIDSISWFARTVWPFVQKAGLSLNIYGNVSREIYTGDIASVSIRGFIDDLHSIYDEIDIVVNPVRFGAGLKIKNLEALGNGLPLVTTSHGAIGIDKEINKSFLVADDPAEFARHIFHLIDDHHLRQELACNALRFAESQLSPEKCFGELLQEINQPK